MTVTVLQPPTIPVAAPMDGPLVVGVSDPTNQRRCGTHDDDVGGVIPSSIPVDTSTTARPAPKIDPSGVDVEWATLRTLADSFAAEQRHRIEVGNRMGAGQIDPTLFAEVFDLSKRSEKRLGTAMRAAFKIVAPAIYQWSDETVGLGVHTMGRLVGTIGHPVIAQPYHWEGTGNDRTLVADEPYVRTVSQLWAYCGHGDPTRRRRKGMTADEAAASGNPTAKMLAHLIAEGCMKAVGGTTTAGATRRRSPYRDVYDEAREKYQAREDWPDARRMNAAIRKTAKEILKDLYNVAAEATA